MVRKYLNVDGDVYSMLEDLRYEWRERSFNTTLRHLLAECGYEPFNDEDDYDDE